MSASRLLRELKSHANPDDARFLQGFFKTGKGQYGEGDVFLGIRGPVVRGLVKSEPVPPLAEIKKLLDSKFHEARMLGLVFLMKGYKQARKDEVRKREIFDFYLANTARINNWDLVDVSCRDIIGAYLLDKPDRSILYRLAGSNDLWEQRIAIITTWMFIKHGQFDDTIRLAEKLLYHPHDLMHKAVGWMLREVGKKDRKPLIAFLERHGRQMPRTALRYAIEHFDQEERKRFMQR